MEIFSLLNVSENWQESYPVLELIDIDSCQVAVKGQGEYLGIINVARDTEGNFISVTRQEAEKFSNIDTYHHPRQCLFDTWETQSSYFLWAGLCSL